MTRGNRPCRRACRCAAGVLIAVAAAAAPARAGDHALIANDVAAAFVNTRSRAVETTIALAGTPPGTQVHVAVAAELAVGYVATSDGTLHAIDLRGRRLLRSVPPRAAPGAVTAMTYDRTSRRLLVARIDTGLDVHDAATLEVLATWPLPATASGLAVDAAGRRVYVASVAPSSALHVLDVATGATIATIPGLEDAAAVVLAPDGRFAYVAYTDHLRGYVGIVDTRTLALVTSIPHSPCEYATKALAIDAGGGRLYVTCHVLPGMRLNLVDAAQRTQAATAAVFRFSEGIATTPDGTELLVIEREQADAAAYVRFVDGRTLATIARLRVVDGATNYGAFTYSLDEAAQAIPVGTAALLLAAAGVAWTAGAALRRRGRA